MDDPQNIPIPTPANEAASEASTTPKPVRERPLILVTDDDNNFREVIVTKLQAEGFEVVQVNNGNDALIKAKEIQPDLVLLDINMPPGPTGTEIALQLQEMPETATAKILFLSGQDDPFPGMSGEKGSVSKELGTEGFIMKTESLDVLVAKVKAALGLG